MNEVYLTGKLVAVHVPEAPASQPKHLVYQLRVAHVNAQKQIRYENYTVNAWRNLATWADANLRMGMEVFVRGHLSQRLTNLGTVTEITALRIAPLLVSRNTTPTSPTVVADMDGEKHAIEHSQVQIIQDAVPDTATTVSAPAIIADADTCTATNDDTICP